MYATKFTPNNEKHQIVANQNFLHETLCILIIYFRFYLLYYSPIICNEIIFGFG